MTACALLVDAFGRIQEEVDAVLAGLTPEQLAHRVDPQANSIGWLVWHLLRVQDDHVAQAFGAEQVWTSDGWADRFALPLPSGDIGYGHTSEQVGLVRVPSAALLAGYAQAVHARTVQHLHGLPDASLQRVVDSSYDPPVTLAVRLVSVLGDDLQHVGQAAFLRGVLERSG
jgi:hypothetical protein